MKRNAGYIVLFFLVSLGLFIDSGWAVRKQGYYPTDDRVIQIISVNLLVLEKEGRVQLIGINPKPDADQAAVKKFMNDLLLNKEVTINFDEKTESRTGNLLVLLYPKGASATVNQMLIEEGLANLNASELSAGAKAMLENPIWKQNSPSNDEDPYVKEMQDEANRTFLKLWGILGGGIILSSLLIYFIRRNR